MKCRKCKIKIQSKQYTGLGKYEKLCANCAIEYIKANHDKIIIQYKENKSVY